MKRQLPNRHDLAPLLRFKEPTWSARERRLARALTVEDLRRIAKRRTPKAAFDYTAGAADGEVSLARAREDNVQRIIVLPLYPQYSATTTASVFDGLAIALRKLRWIPELRFISHYHFDDAWVEAITDRIRAHQNEHGVPDKLLFSFHGIPKRYLLNGDPYYCQCQSSARRIAQKLKLEPRQWQATFQSRLGRAEWLRPYTDETLEELGRQKTEHVQVVCPGFAVDCLETIDEIGLENRELFQEAGGGRYEYIPALNAENDHARLLTELCWRHGQGWPEFGKNQDINEQALNDRVEQADRAARQLGLDA